MTYKRILVPVDGSPTSNRGLREAIRLAAGHKAKLEIVHIVDEYYAFMGAQVGAAAADLVPALKKAGQQVLDKAKALVRKHGLACNSILLESVTAPAAFIIVREARRWRADLIVIGTHGRRGLRRIVLGSDAEQIVRTSPVPVLLVRAKQT